MAALQGLFKEDKLSARKLPRCHSLLLAHEGHTARATARSLCVGTARSSILADVSLAAGSTGCSPNAPALLAPDPTVALYAAAYGLVARLLGM